LKKKHGDHPNHERWLVSYADFITLLFAFFVVMYAISQADLAKFRKVSESLKKAFNEKVEPSGGMAVDQPAGGGAQKTTAGGDPGIEELRDLLEEVSSGQLKLETDSRGLVIRPAVNDLFAPGEVVVPEDLRPLLDTLGKVLATSTHLVRVEGFADAAEKATLSDYPSLWELSAARASWVARYWLRRFNIDPSRLSVAGYADQRPVRSGNRRIEILVLKDRKKPVPR